MRPNLPKSGLLWMAGMLMLILLFLLFNYLLPVDNDPPEPTPWLPVEAPTHTPTPPQTGWWLDLPTPLPLLPTVTSIPTSSSGD
jgi:hypothetical protein